ncbi:MAG: PspC domain-containing protein, partial [Verrucomicrobiaceae bacterium]
GVGLAAGFVAIVLSLIHGSHIGWTTGSSGTTFDIRIGGGGGLPASIFGTISILCLILGGACLAASTELPPASTGMEPNGGQPANFSVLQFLKNLKRSRRDVWLGGVCGGLGTYSPVPTWVWRVIFLILVFTFGTGILAYVILWICMPQEPAPAYSAAVPPVVPPDGGMK